MKKVWWLLVPALLACSEKSKANAESVPRTNNNLEQIMRNAIQGDTVASWHPYVEFKSEKGKRYYISIIMLREKKPDALRFVVYPDSFKQQIVLDRAMLYSVSRDRTRYEDEQFSVVQNPQTKESWHGLVDYENDQGGEVIVDAAMNLLSGSLEKIGIKKSALNEILKVARPENLIAPVEEPQRKQHVLSRGSSDITKYHVFLQKIEYSGQGALDYTSLKDSKLWEWYVKEGEKAICGIAVYVRLMKYGCFPSCGMDITPDKSNETAVIVSFDKVRDNLFK